MFIPLSLAICSRSAARGVSQFIRKEGVVRTTVMLLLCACLLGCATTLKQNQDSASLGATSGAATRDGSSYERAIIITEKTETSGIDAEYKWLSVHYPGYTMDGQSLLFEKGRSYDLMEFKTPDGSKHSIYFDITMFFGIM